MQQIIDFTVVENRPLHSLYSLLTLRPQQAQQQLPPMKAGQFVQVRIDNAATFLRRPISINDFDTGRRHLMLLVRDAGPGTRWLTELPAGANLNVVLPLGNSFPVESSDAAPLLVGGGVGVAPMLCLAKAYVAAGITPTVLIGARTAADVLLLDTFRSVCPTEVCTEDGSMGTKGMVTASPLWQKDTFTSVSCCGPAPMMKAIARLCRAKQLPCRVSLENMMACGLGACLCCVEKTVRGNVCVCTEGPVFPTDALTWS